MGAGRRGSVRPLILDNVTDPWAWLHAEAEGPEVDLDAHPVSAIVLTDAAETMRPLLAAQSVPLAEVIVADTLADGIEQATGEWLWLFPRAVRPASDALEGLLRTAADSTGVGLLGPLTVQSQRRARVDLIESCGLTVTPAGRVLPAVEGGEPDQGQLATMAVLGVDLSAALIRREVWSQVDGVVAQLPESLAGVELGRRVNSLGLRVVAEPAARVKRTRAPEPDAAGHRAWELRLAASGRSWWTRLRLLLGSLLGALGFLLGKDAALAAAELRGIRLWLGDSDAAKALADRPVDVRTLAGLTPTRRELFAKAVDRAAGRVAEDWERLGDSGEETSLDELTGDDFADSRRPRRASPVTVGAYLVLALAVVAGWRLIGDGRLSGTGLLPSPERWTDLLHAWLDPVAGQPGPTGAPWLGSTALAALATFGQVEWLVTIGFLIAVPLTWVLALRLLRALDVDGPAAVLAAFAYALGPVLVGALGGGWLGVLTWAVLLPLLAHTMFGWVRHHSWRSAGAIGLWLAFAVVEVPLTWPLVVVAMACLPSARSARGAGQVALAAASGLVGLGATVAGWWSFPGRYLTGASPTLASDSVPDPWLLALGHNTGTGVAPLWVSATVVGAAWLAALIGLWRRPRAAAPGFIAAAVGLLAAVGLTRFVVVVPPGVEARPQAHPWLVLMIGGLVFAASRGLTGVSAALRHHTLGARHAVVLALAAVAVAAVGVGAAWWAWAGTASLQRTQLDQLPPFVRLAMTSQTPVRTLAVAKGSDDIRWTVLEGDLPRLGDDERGLAAETDPQRTLAASVVNRLLSGSADDELRTDLARLGIGYVWLKGSDPDLRTAIGNVPGLGVGTGDDDGATWPVPSAGRATVEGGATSVTGDGATVEAGAENRRLVLAEVADARWWATLDGRPLPPVTLPDGRQAFDLGAGGGVLHYGLAGGAPLWPWLQLAGLVVLAVLAAPRTRRRR